MRKTSFIITSALTISLLSSLLVGAIPRQIPNTCPSKPYPVSNFFTRGLQGIFGFNLIASSKAESEIKKQLKSIGKGDYNVEIKPYSAFDLVAGKFKNFELKGKNIEIDNAYISSFETRSLCDFTYIDYNKNPVVPLAPIFIGFKGTVTESDLNKILSSPKSKEEFSKIKVNFLNTEISLVNLLDSRVDIKNNKIYFATDMSFAGFPKFMKIPVRIAAGLKAYNDKVRLTDIEVAPNSMGIDLGALGNIIEMLNPVLFDLDSFEKNGADINIRNLTINNDKIDVSGTVWVPAKNS